MDAWIDGALGVVLDRSLEEIFGAVLLALALSMVGALAGVRLCRAKRDETSRLTAVMLVVSLLSMGLAAAFVRQSSVPKRAGTMARPTPSPSSGFSPESSRMVAVLDADGDGRVSNREFYRASVALGTPVRPFPGLPFDPSGGRRDDHHPRPGTPAARDLHRDAPDDGGGMPTPAGSPVADTELQP